LRSLCDHLEHFNGSLQLFGSLHLALPLSEVGSQGRSLRSSFWYV